jgi:hypothetical protein
MAGAAALGAIGQGLSASRAKRATEAQANAAKESLGEYAEALKQKASKERGGISLAQRNQMATSGALQRGSEVQAARDENKRGNKAQDIELEKELANVSQQGAAQQMQGIDALSQQQAQMSKARRDQLEMAALQTEQQAQAIDPEAMGLQAAAGAPAAITGAIAQPAMAVGQSYASPWIQAQGLKSGLNPLSGAEGFGEMTEEQKVMMISPYRGSSDV